MVEVLFLAHTREHKCTCSVACGRDTQNQPLKMQKPQFNVNDDVDVIGIRFNTWDREPSDGLACIILCVLFGVLLFVYLFLYRRLGCRVQIHTANTDIDLWPPSSSE